MEYNQDREIAQERLAGMGDWRKRHALFFRTTALLLIFAFVVYDITWAQGGPATSPVIASHSLPLTIPRDRAITKETNIADSDEIILNIQDAHASLSAQHSIVDILQTLAADYNLNVVSLEGAAGPLDVSLLRSFPDAEIKKEAAEYLMRKGRMSAGEFFSVVSEKPIKLYGAEDDALYQANVDAFKSAIENKVDCVRNTDGLIGTLLNLEPKVYSEDLVNLNKNSRLHADKKLSFADYWTFITELIQKRGIELAPFGNLSKLLKTISLEKEIDFTAANNERRLLIDWLSKTLPKEKMEELMLKSLQFKTERISQADFHRYLAQLITDAPRYPNLLRFTEYIAIYETIDLAELTSELEESEDFIRGKLFRSDEERTLHNFTKAAFILKRLFEVALVNGDYDFITKNGVLFDKAALGDFIRMSYQKYNFPVENSYDLEAIFSHLDEAIEFYNVAQKRNSAMVANTIKAMRKNNEHVAALITGGYHSKGLTNLLKEKKLSYLVVMPKFETGDEHNRPYIAVLTNKTQPYEELIESGKYTLAFRAYTYTGDAEKLMEFLIGTYGMLYAKGEPLEPRILQHYRLFKAQFDTMQKERAGWDGHSKLPFTPDDFAEVFGLAIDPETKEPKADESGNPVFREGTPELNIRCITSDSKKIFIIRKLKNGKLGLPVALTMDEDGKMDLDMVPDEALEKVQAIEGEQDFRKIIVHQITRTSPVFSWTEEQYMRFVDILNSVGGIPQGYEVRTIDDAASNFLIAQDRDEKSYTINLGYQRYSPDTAIKAAFHVGVHEAMHGRIAQSPEFYRGYIDSKVGHFSDERLDKYAEEVIAEAMAAADPRAKTAEVYTQFAEEGLAYANAHKEDFHPAYFAMMDVVCWNFAQLPGIMPENAAKLRKISYGYRPLGGEAGPMRHDVLARIFTNIYKEKYEEAVRVFNPNTDTDESPQKAAEELITLFENLASSLERGVENLTYDWYAPVTEPLLQKKIGSVLRRMGNDSDFDRMFKRLCDVYFKFYAYFRDAPRTEEAYLRAREGWNFIRYAFGLQLYEASPEKFLRHFLSPPDADLRELRNLAGAVSILLRFLEDKNSAIRIAAIKALGIMGGAGSSYCAGRYFDKKRRILGLP